MIVFLFVFFCWQVVGPAQFESFLFIGPKSSAQSLNVHFFQGLAPIYAAHIVTGCLFSAAPWKKIHGKNKLNKTEYGEWFIPFQMAKK
ncbi:hypothetical protein CW304_01830 [Bacillus sp. UFRGS-B20]|nr:hypothetical protein CW304_01830 [Bacillus sp. UFRGS-B20]